MTDKSNQAISISVSSAYFISFCVENKNRLTNRTEGTNKYTKEKNFFECPIYVYAYIYMNKKKKEKRKEQVNITSEFQ